MLKNLVRVIHEMTRVTQILEDAPQASRLSFTPTECPFPVSPPLPPGLSTSAASRQFLGSLFSGSNFLGHHLIFLSPSTGLISLNLC